jgi:3-oxoacyl-[acyl-carrier-protein] synthase-3
MPERVVRNDEFQVSASELSDDAFFAGVDERRFASPDYTSAELGTQALKKLLERNGIRATELDLIICSAQLNDVFSPGVGTAIQHAVGATSAAVVQVDNGCCSWVSSIDMARAYIDSGRIAGPRRRRLGHPARGLLRRTDRPLRPRTGLR